MRNDTLGNTPNGIIAIEQMTSVNWQSSCRGKIMQPHIKQPKSSNRTETDIDRAVRRIYQKYGTDLFAFVRDVEMRLGTERSATTARTKGPKRPHGD